MMGMIAPGPSNPITVGEPIPEKGSDSIRDIILRAGTNGRELRLKPPFAALRCSRIPQASIHCTLDAVLANKLQLGAPLDHGLCIGLLIASRCKIRTSGINKDIANYGGPQTFSKAQCQPTLSLTDTDWLKREGRFDWNAGALS